MWVEEVTTLYWGRLSLCNKDLALCSIVKRYLWAVKTNTMHIKTNQITIYKMIQDLIIKRSTLLLMCRMFSSKSLIKTQYSSNMCKRTFVMKIPKCSKRIQRSRQRSNSWLTSSKYSTLISRKTISQVLCKGGK
jgi:hypothetical protein